MKNELVILFIPKEEKYWIEDSSEGFYEVPVGLNSSSERALLVVEDRVERDAPSTELIDNAIERGISEANRIYVALHGGSPHKEAHRKEMVGTSQVSALETYSRVSGNPIYEAFKKVVESIQSEPETIDDDTSEALGDLIDQIGPDWELEMKLEMLHRCLTPEGARRVNNPRDFREELRTYRASLVDEPLIRSVAQNDETTWSGTVGDVVSALARSPNGEKKIEFTDCSDSNYQEALGVMRDTLLQEE